MGERKFDDGVALLDEGDVGEELVASDGAVSSQVDFDFGVEFGEPFVELDDVLLLVF